MAMNLSHGGIKGPVGQFDHHPIAGFELANGANNLTLGIPHQAEPLLEKVLGG
jgi:hypothetical protein